MKRRFFTVPFFVILAALLAFSHFAFNSISFFDTLERWAAFSAVFILIWTVMKNLVIPLFDDMSSPDEHRRQLGWQIAAGGFDLGMGEAGISRNSKVYTLDENTRAEDSQRK